MSFLEEVQILTYPRSGANYLKFLLFNYSAQYIKVFHNEKNLNGKIITIARNPFDSIHSSITMAKHYDLKESFSNIYVDEYINIYKFLYKNADVVINYEDLVKFPEKVAKKVCNILKFSKLSPLYPITLKDNKDYYYLVSSKTSARYTEKNFNIEDISDCYNPYKKLLSKAIDLTKA